MLSFIILYLGLGAIAGLLGGLFGLGGGLVIVPALYLILPIQGIPPEQVMQVAIGTSLATILFTSIASLRAHHKRGAVLWPLARAMAPGIATGALAGALLADKLSAGALRVFFGVFELLIALQMGLSLLPHGVRPLPGRVGLAGIGAVIGIVSSLIGIGGGTLTVPFLHVCQVNMRQAVATSAACGLPIALAGSLGFIIMGWNNMPPMKWSLGYIYLPAMTGIAIASILFAPLGAAWAHRLPLLQLRRWFAALLALIAIKMLVG
ncbi:MAG: hypothetical protein A2V90_01775 [Gammaproteobacteria bacterium RBG_16_57_12]|nr:MAG: hypothetical protein A2V90_01775 [Gammaproteobacteria bacterium RBG_16_57_12]